MRTASRGFTLVEIMIVVAVVGVGAGIALVNMSEQIAEAKAQADGVAMANFIRAQSRTAKEQMQAIKVRPGATSGSVVDVYAVNKCSDTINPSKVRATKAFLSTTKLVIVNTTDGAFCWDRFGEPPPPSSTSTTIPRRPGQPPEADDSDGQAELQISAGIKKVTTRAIRASMAGAKVTELNTDRRKKNPSTAPDVESGR
jgi:prepilin-type N-terminal cleavage/methylation domain-containing protein